MSCHHVTFYPFDRLTPFLWVGWMITVKTRPNGLIDTIASNIGYKWKMPYANSLTHSLTHSHTPNIEMLLHLKMGFEHTLK